jgi:Yip1 domain
MDIRANIGADVGFDFYLISQLYLYAEICGGMTRTRVDALCLMQIILVSHIEAGLVRFAMFVHDLCDLISRPRELFDRLAGRPVFLRAVTFIALVQTVIVLFCLCMKHSILSLETAAGSLVIVVSILSVKFAAAALFIYLVITISDGNSGLLYRQCLSVAVYSYFVLLLGSFLAVMIGMVASWEKGTEFSIVTFLNVNNLLAAVHLPRLLMMERADIFGAWSVCLMAIGIGTLSSLKFPVCFFVALVEWSLVAAIQESVLQYLKLPFYN